MQTSRRGFIGSVLGATLLPWARVPGSPVAAKAAPFGPLTHLYLSKEAIEEIKKWTVTDAKLVKAIV